MRFSLGGETIRPKIGDQVFRFGLIRPAGAKDADELAMVTAAQLRGRGRIHRQDALDEGEVLLMTRGCFDRHKGKREWSWGSGPSTILTGAGPCLEGFEPPTC